jgi:Tfp pilus assembly protein PilV
MPERAASRQAPVRVILRVLVTVFALAVCALAFAHTTPAPSSQMRAAMTTQMSITATEPLMDAVTARTAAADSTSRPGPSTYVLVSASSAASDCACCAANCCHAAVFTVVAQPAAAASHAYPNAPPTIGARSCTRTSGVEPVPRTASLTELSLLRI